MTPPVNITPPAQASPGHPQSNGTGSKAFILPAAWASVGGGVLGVVGLLVTLILFRGGKPEARVAPEPENNSGNSLHADSGSSHLSGAFSADAIFAKASPSVVRIEVHDRASRSLAQGSGFVVSEEGLIATNHHVIEGAYSGKVIFGDGSTFPIVAAAGYDLESDVALLKIKGPRFPALALAANEIIPIGKKVFAIGSPIGLTNTLSEGLASGHRQIGSSFKLIQTTAPISHGSSGGPLLSDNCKVLGITTLSFSEGQNLNFAVPAERIAKLIASHSNDTTLAEAGSRRLQHAQHRPIEMPTAPESEGWTKEEKENLGHFFRSMNRQVKAYKLFYQALKDKTTNTAERNAEIEDALNAASEEARLVKPKALDKAHPDMPRMFRETFLRELDLARIAMAGLTSKSKEERDQLSEPVREFVSRSEERDKWWNAHRFDLDIPDDVPFWDAKRSDIDW
ncbi:MAG: S1C family serine protease [Gemmataceae bacterium]